MKKSLIDERYDFQQYIIESLKKENKYIERENKDLNKYLIDKEILFNFLKNTQEQTLNELKKELTEEQILEKINEHLSRKKHALLEALKTTITINNKEIYLMYAKPASKKNKELNKKYNNNILSVVEEVYNTEKQRVDLVVFINGLPLIAIELKSKYSGQNYLDAINQYKSDRDPNTRLFNERSGVLVSFAMDTENIYMTTKLNKRETRFLPFNQGKGEGIEGGSGNPEYKLYPVDYLWKEILKKDNLIKLITDFISVNDKDILIFPRYHQWKTIIDLEKDIKINKTKKDYLIQHSAGSGKTYTIATLAHSLASLHDKEDNIIYDKVIVVTDRKVIDKQLQKAIKTDNHQDGYVNTIDEDKNSNDLKESLESNDKIVVSTIQKFQYIVDEIESLKDKTFAVIIDEAHSSTSGENMKDLKISLNKNKTIESAEDLILENIRAKGKQENVSMFAFTATPKDETLRIFSDNRKAFNVYSMKQAIEEGYILDVLKNYTTYKTYLKIEKIIKDDPELNSQKAKREIRELINTNDENIEQRVKIITRHFVNTVMPELDYKGKAMVITPSRLSAVKYKIAMDKYINKNNIKNVNTLVAFSGDVELDGETYNERNMNGISENLLAEEFDTDKYNILIVANKYQTGFDQDKLCGMYVLKKLSGVNAVQTLSRLNRVNPDYPNKETYIIDFENKYEDIEESFRPFYNTTILSKYLDINNFVKLYLQMISNVEDKDIEAFIMLYYKNNYQKDITFDEKEKLVQIINKYESILRNDNGLLQLAKRYIKLYDYIKQVPDFENENMEKLYILLIYATRNIKEVSYSKEIDINDKIIIKNVRQFKEGENSESSDFNEYKAEHPISMNSIKTDTKKQLLSKIINDINSTTLNRTFEYENLNEIVNKFSEESYKDKELRRIAKDNDRDLFVISFIDKKKSKLLINLYRTDKEMHSYIKKGGYDNEIVEYVGNETYMKFKEEEKQEEL